MVGLSLTVSEIYGVIVRPLPSIISGMAEPIEFEFCELLDYVDPYKMPRPVGHILETVQERHAQNQQHFVTFFKNVHYKLDEASPDDSTLVTDIWAKYQKKLPSGSQDISGQSVTSISPLKFFKNRYLKNGSTN
jgi:hypothetical protein